jgi:hypothetical protein
MNVRGRFSQHRGTLDELTALIGLATNQVRRLSRTRMKGKAWRSSSLTPRFALASWMRSTNQRQRGDAGCRKGTGLEHLEGVVMDSTRPNTSKGARVLSRYVASIGVAPSEMNFMKVSG